MSKAPGGGRVLCGHMEAPDSTPSPSGWRARWEWFLAVPDSPQRRELRADWRRRQPGFLEAVRGDARAAALGRGDRFEFESTLDLLLQVVRLSVMTDAFFALVCYRAKAACQVRGIPLVPRLLHRMAITSGQISIGDPVVVEPGICMPHGQVVIDGLTHVGPNVNISPFVTIGLRAPDFVGPTIGAGSRIGTGAKVIGNVTVGRHAVVGANSVVLGDVPDRATVVGAPARETAAG